MERSLTDEKICMLQRVMVMFYQRETKQVIETVRACSKDATINIDVIIDAYCRELRIDRASLLH